MSICIMTLFYALTRSRGYSDFLIKYITTVLHIWGYCNLQNYNCYGCRVFYELIINWGIFLLLLLLRVDSLFLSTSLCLKPWGIRCFFMIVLEVDVSELHSDFLKKVLLWISTFSVSRTTKLIGHFIFRIAQLKQTDLYL